MTEEQKQTKEEINLKEIRKKLEAKIEDALPEEFKKRHEQQVVEDVDIENIREVDEGAAKRIVEALLFSSSKPVTVSEIKKVLRGYTPSKIQLLLRELSDEYERENRSFRIHEIANGYELATQGEYYHWLKKLDLQKRSKAASFAALETLAVLAYKQPVTRGEIEELRGVDVSGTLATLLERNFIKIVGRKEVPGRPLLYSTTDFFLQHFGLRSLSDLPRVHEIKEIVEAAIQKDTLLEQQKIEEQRKEQARKRALEQAEVEALAQERAEIKQKYDEIADEVEGVKIMRPKQLSDIVSPKTEETAPEGEGQAGDEKALDEGVGAGGISENSDSENISHSDGAGAGITIEGSSETTVLEEPKKEYETKRIKADMEDTHESG